jgi:hypothetical protein
LEPKIHTPNSYEVDSKTRIHIKGIPNLVLSMGFGSFIVDSKPQTH